MEWKTEWNRTGAGTNILYKGVSNRWTGIWNGTVEWKRNGTELALVQIYYIRVSLIAGLEYGTERWNGKLNGTELALFFKVECV